MKNNFSKYLLQHSKIIPALLIGLGIISAVISVFMWSQPANNMAEIIENDVQIQTSFDYQATYKENILYPEGETIEPGEMLFRRITDEIPLQLSSAIISESPVQAEGTHQVKLVIQAGEYWEKELHLEEKQTFKQDGTELNMFHDGEYVIDFELIEDFILDVEEELAIRPDFYSIHVYPNVEGTITSNGVTQDIPFQESLTFQIFNEEIVLASEQQQFKTPLPFKTTAASANTFSIFDLHIPIFVMQVIPTIIALLFILSPIVIKKKSNASDHIAEPLQSERIAKKYHKRLFPVLSKIDVQESTIVHLPSFIHVLEIADSKDLPIFYYADANSQNHLYFVIDEGFIYQFKLVERYFSANRTIGKQTEKMKKESDPAYVLDQ